MRFALGLLSTMIFACSTGVPTSPNIVVATTGSFAVVVVDSTGACIPGATVQVVGGPGIGQTVTQSTSCSAWGPDDNMVFKGLTPNAELTLRASASGYLPQEKKVVASEGARTVEFEPARIP